MDDFHGSLLGHLWSRLSLLYCPDGGASDACSLHRLEIHPLKPSWDRPIRLPKHVRELPLNMERLMVYMIWRKHSCFGWFA